MSAWKNIGTSNEKQEDNMNNLEYLYNNDPEQIGILMDVDCDNCKYNGKCHLAEYEPCTGDWLFSEYNPDDFNDSWKKIEQTFNDMKKYNPSCSNCTIMKRCKNLAGAQINPDSFDWDAFSSGKIAVKCNSLDDACDFISKVVDHGIEYEEGEPESAILVLDEWSDPAVTEMYYFVWNNDEFNGFLDACWSKNCYPLNNIDTIVTWKKGMI